MENRRGSWMEGKKMCKSREPYSGCYISWCLQCVVDKNKSTKSRWWHTYCSSTAYSTQAYIYASVYMAPHQPLDPFMWSIHPLLPFFPLCISICKWCVGLYIYMFFLFLVYTVFIAISWWWRYYTAAVRVLWKAFAWKKSADPHHSWLRSVLYIIWIPKIPRNLQQKL